jgi:hypothetical protein
LISNGPSITEPHRQAGIYAGWMLSRTANNPACFGWSRAQMTDGETAGEPVMVARVLMTLSAAIILALGVTHLVYTFRGPKLTPRDPTLETSMKAIAPVITGETTMWNAWIGFNASHSLGAILFGLVYGYLALIHPGFLFQSRFLLLVGLALLGSYTWLGKVYWFSVPLTGILIALACYALGVVAHLISQSSEQL